MNTKASLQRRLQQGIDYARQGRYDDAIACLTEVIAHDPHQIEAQLNLGNIYLSQGRPAEAAARYHTVLVARPDFAAVHFNLGLARYREGRLEDAVASYQRAIKFKPDYPEAYSNLGHTYLDLGRPEEAAASCQKAIALRPDLAPAHQNLGVAFLRQGRLEDAVAASQRAIALNQDFVEAYHTLCLALFDMGRMDEALAGVQKAIALRPDDDTMYIFQSALCAHMGRNTEVLGLIDTALKLDLASAAGLSARCAALQYLASTTPAESYAAHRRFAEACEAPLKPHWRPHANARDPARRLRIGYVSADFRLHSVASFIEPVLAHHDRAQVEVYCYYNYTERDEVTARLAALADHWLTCFDLTDEQLAGRIRQDGIDILVDLAGHTNDHRLLTFARKPAPVQVTWLGYPATTGLTAMDYRLCTLDTDPPGQEAWHSETLYRLPRSLWCYRPPGERTLASRTPALQSGYVTFGSMNSYPKISPEAFAVWMDILRALPDARLVMTSVPEGSVRPALARRVAGHGIAPERVIAYARLPQEQYQQVMRQIDIALDPFPYTGTTTTCQTLRSGIPVVTLTGETSVARSGYALLKTVGLEELAAPDPARYIKIATDLAMNPQRLNHLRTDLPARFDRSVLRDEAGFTRDLETAYRVMWRKWCGVSDSVRRRETITPGPALDAERAERALQQGNDSYLQGRLDEAAACFREVLTLVPDHAEARRKLGNVYFSQNRLDEAVACYQQALAIDPALTAAHYNLGLAYARQNRLDEAAASYLAALSLQPEFAEAHVSLGLVYSSQGRLDETVQCMHRALAIRPEYVLAQYNLGLAQFNLDRLSDAVSSYQRVLALKPDYAEAWFNLGNAYNKLGKPEDAAASFKQAVALKPDYAEAWYNLGNTCLDQRRLDDAVAACQTAINLRPDYAEAHNNLGQAYFRQRRLDEALRSYRQTLALKPDFAAAHTNLGLTLASVGRMEEAMRCFEKSLSLEPDSVGAHSARLFAMLYVADTSPAASYAAHRRFAEACEAPLRRHRRSHPNSRDPARRLKIGYVSADFLRHSVAYFIEPILAHHDRTLVEVYCYYNCAEHDEVTEHLTTLADHWLTCASLTDEQLADRISKDGIDILVDLNGHTDGHRLLAFARKPAPVQVTYLGYPATTGLDAMDYRLCTADTDPPGAEAWHSEALYRLPRTLWCYRPLAERAPAGPTPAAQRGYVTFGSLNNLAKVSPETVTCWAGILRAVTSSRLVMTSVPEGSARTALQQRFADHGIAPERVVLHDKLPYADYWRLLREIDIALDPFPYTGTTTTCETLWSGIPVVTLTGQTSVARSGYALLKTVGLTELAAADEADYVRRAVDLANDTARLTRLREALPARFDASALRDEAGLTRNLEHAFRAMWQRWCATPETPT